MENINEHIIINHVLFDLTRNPLMLTQSDCPANSLMIDPSVSKEGYYHILLDRDNKNHIIQLTGYINLPSSAKIPAAIFEADYVANFTIAESINSYSLLHKLNFLVPDRYIFERLNGHLPNFYIGDDVFGFDGENEVLIPKDGLSAPISLSALEWIDSTNPYDNWNADKKHGLYHIQTRQIVDVDLELMTKWPNGVINIVIPAPIFCDPIGVARNRSLADFTLTYPPNRLPGLNAQLYDVQSQFYTQLSFNMEKTAKPSLKERSKYRKKLPF